MWLAKFDTDGKMFFTLTRALLTLSVHIIYPSGLDDQKIVEFSKTHDTASVYSKNMDFDSVSVAFFDNNKPVDTSYLHKGRKEVFTRLFTFKLWPQSKAKAC